MKLNINLKPLFPNNVIFSECFSFARMFAAFIKKQSKTKIPQNNSKNPTPTQTKKIYQNKTKFIPDVDSFF